MRDLHELQREVDVARKRVRELAEGGDFTVSSFMVAAKEELVALNLAKYRLENAQTRH